MNTPMRHPPFNREGTSFKRSVVGSIGESNTISNYPIMTPSHFYASDFAQTNYVDIIIDGGSRDTGRRIFLQILQIAEQPLARFIQYQLWHSIQFFFERKFQRAFH